MCHCWSLPPGWDCPSSEPCLADPKLEACPALRAALHEVSHVPAAWRPASHGWSASGALGVLAAAKWQWHSCQVYGCYLQWWDRRAFIDRSARGGRGQEGVLGSRARAPNLILGCFFFFLGGWGIFCFLIPTLRVTFTSLIWLLPNKKKSLLTNGKPCTSASSALQFNCFKERPCVVLS